MALFSNLNGFVTMQFIFPGLTLSIFEFTADSMLAEEDIPESEFVVESVNDCKLDFENDRCKKGPALVFKAETV
eukprot:scaffold48245_cov24-Prasinocladus_malaysianus.AAC.1